MPDAWRAGLTSIRWFSNKFTLTVQYFGDLAGQAQILSAFQLRFDSKIENLIFV
jgi:hypothetical protein